MNKYITYYANGTHDIKQVWMDDDEHQNITHAYSNVEDGLDYALQMESLINHYINKLKYELY